MALFKRKSGGPQTTGAPWEQEPAPIDPTFGEPLTAAYLAAMDGGDWQEASRLLHSATPRAREFAVWASNADSTAAVATARQWMAEWPEDPMGPLVAGISLTAWAWEARGRGDADTVGQDDWQLFFQRLQEADGLLRQAARAMPADPLPWASMVTTGRGLQIPLEEQTSRFEEASRREPWNTTATMMLLQNLCAKWYGSHDQMYAFARFAVAESPEGSPAAAALPMACIEHVLAAREELGGSDPAAAQILSVSVIREIEAAADRSIFHPAFVPEGLGLSAANTFLMSFFMAKRWVRCDQTIRLLQRRYSPMPYRYFAPPSLLCRKIELVTAERMAGVGPNAPVLPLR